MKQLTRIYLGILLATTLFACKQTKFVPEGKYLLKKNTIEVTKKSGLSESDLTEVIRQQPNFKTLGMKLKLTAFNMVDSTKVANKRIVKNLELRKKNIRLSQKEDRINQKRIAKAKRKNRDWYTKKVIPLKDTLEPRRFFREWLKYKMGQRPVVLDTVLHTKSINQLAVYLKKKGFYYGQVTGDISYHKNKKAIAHYVVVPGKRYFIDSVKVNGNSSLLDAYAKFLRKEYIEPLNGKPFDEDVLGDYRQQLATLFRNEAYYGFSFSNIDFVVDTMRGDFKVAVEMNLTDRLIKSKDYADSIIRIPHKVTYVKNAYFHVIDTTYMSSGFEKKINELGLNRITDGYLTTTDTTEFAKVYLNKDEKKKRGIDVNLDTLNVSRIATFYFNERMFVKPEIMELQNYLEKENYYKEYYLSRTYTRLQQLGIFSTVKPIIHEIEGTNYIDVHYFLVPAKKQSFGFEPKATTSNGFLGVSASLNYSNKNLFRGAQNLTFTLSGGFESQPPVFDKSVDGEKIKKAGRSFNTFEIGPSVKLDMPGLLPIRRAVFMSKRQRARTVVSMAYNFQNRSDFSRKNFQLNYLWKFYGGETQIFQIGLPGASVVKYSNITKSDGFQTQIDDLNDVFLRNAYSDQFIWQDWKLTYEYNTTEKKNKKSKANIYFKTTFDPAGNLLSIFNKSLDTNEIGQKTIFGLGYSQFVRLDNEIIYAQPITKKSSFNSRLLIGGGVPFGNSETSLPYDYSFFGGGANDNRGWRARALGPGSYKYYLDSNRTATQIGDIRIGASVEYRFSMGGIFKGAVFSDAGNVWTYKNDVNRPGAQISGQLFEQLAVSAGVGLRVDLDFFIVRLDLGIPLSNPALPKGSRWIFQSRDAFNQELLNTPNLDLTNVPRPFNPVLHFGIGFPF